MNIVCKTGCDLSLSRYFDQNSVKKGILQIKSEPASKISVVSHLRQFSNYDCVVFKISLEHKFQ